MGAFEMNGTRPAVTVPLYYGGRVIAPCKCGIGGTRSTTMVTRDDAAPAPGRKGLTVTGYPFDAVRVRMEPEDILSIPAPAEKTQPGSIPNPGGKPDSPAVSASYSTAKAFTDVTLLSVYTFQGGATRAQLRATGRNWGQSTGVAEVHGFYVEKADPSNPQRKPGMPCPVP